MRGSGQKTKLAVDDSNDAINQGRNIKLRTGIKSEHNEPSFPRGELPLSMAEEEDMVEDEGVLAKTTGRVDAIFEEEEVRFSV